MPDLRFEAIGTLWSIRTDEPLTAGCAARIQARIADFDLTYSRFRADSAVSRFAEAAGTWQLPDDAEPMLDFYQALSRATGGSVTPLVGRAMEHLGYGADYSFVSQPGPVEIPAWDSVLTRDGATLTSSQPILLDFGCAGKGYLVDLVAGLLDQAGLDHYLIDAGGDLRQRGPVPVAVGLENPLDPTEAIGIAQLDGRALCASASNRRRWGSGLHHIIDPTTGAPASTVLATWVVADTALVADGLATALFFVDPDRLTADFRFEYVQMLADGSVRFSLTFPGELFS